MRLPYSVLDADGRPVASGTVNGPAIALDAGRYRLFLPSDPDRTEDIVVRQETLTQITL